MRIVCTIVPPRPLDSIDYRRILDARAGAFSVVLLGRSGESSIIRERLLRLAITDCVLVSDSGRANELARIMGADEVRTL